MSTPWNSEEFLASPFAGQFDAESPFAAVGTTGKSPAYPAYQEFERAYGFASTGLDAEAVSLPLAHESPEQSTVRQATATGTTTELWVPGAERLANPRSAGGTYLDAPWRFVFHTIEGEPSVQGFRSLAAGHANPPHLWAMPSADLLLQTIPLNRSAYALARPGLIQTNRLRTVQVECWGFAAKMVNATPEMLTWLADRVLAPVARLVPINLNQVPPTGPGEPCYGKNSSCRMRPDEWQSFNGVCGHKHVPDNDHWDPGQLNLGAIAARARASIGETNYIRRERPLADHDGPGFEAERDDEESWLLEGQNGHHQMAWMAPSGNSEGGLGITTWTEFDQLAPPPTAPNTEPELVRSALSSGMTDENRLTDLVFFRRYPARNGRLISRDEPNYPALSQEWLSIRDTLVRPILAGTPGPRPPHPVPARPRPIPAGLDARILRTMELLVNQYGYPVNGAAGLVGNLVAESEVQPDRIEGSRSAAPMRAPDFAGQMRDFTAEQVRDRDYAKKQGPRGPGIGIAQWTSPSRRAGLFSHTFRGQQVGAAVLFDLDAQVDYLVTELRRDYSSVNATLLAPGVTVNDAADDVVYCFEVPGAILQNGQHLPRSDARVQKVFDERRRHAQRALQVYRAAHPSSQPSPGPGGGTPTGTHDVVSVRGITVARQIAPQIEALLAAAEADGVRLSGDGFRSPARQIELRKQNCGSSHYDIYDKPSSQCTPMTAKPGTSNHERGLAIDFHGIDSRESPGFQWLAANAHRFGLFNLPSEAWHWSVDGK